MLLELWNERPLNVRNILADEYTASNAIVDMAEDLDTFITMRRRLATSKTNIVTNPGEEDKASEFIDKHLMIDDTKLGPDKFFLEDTLLHSTTYIRDAKKEISNFRAENVVLKKELKDVKLQV
ncbi:uncharacterized protein DS421_17g592800 [Arachis hypogaea]|nr:uncharacterized protein DS421_17g592800 [Arachis hypogaea]